MKASFKTNSISLSGFIIWYAKAASLNVGYTTPSIVLISSKLVDPFFHNSKIYKANFSTTLSPYGTTGGM